MNRTLKAMLGGVALAALVPFAAQADDLKIGLIAPLSGPFASTGLNLVNGAKLYLEQHGDTVAGRKVQLIIKDDTGVSGAVSKRVAQELLIKDKVDILAGFGLTPAAFAVAPLATETKKPMVVMYAATSSITTRSPYIVRTSMTAQQTAAPLGTWAYDHGIKTIFTVTADYGPGHDSTEAFDKTFTAAGGKIIGAVSSPLTSPDFAPFLQRIKDAKPDATFVFLPNGPQGVNFVKGYKERGLDKEGIQLLATGGVFSEDELSAMGDEALGIITSFHYSDAHDSPENKAFVAAYQKAHPNLRPNMVTVGAYDGMHLIYQVLEATKGDASGDAFIAAAKGAHWMSPRGPVEIDPETRDIIQDIYIRKVERVDGILKNVEFDVVPKFKDPGK